MNQFSTDWLGLREPVDAASRSAILSATLARTLRRDLSHGMALRVVDLGAGTAANFRYLAPWIGGSQDWLLLEGDPALLAAINGSLISWAGSCGAHVAASANEIVVRGNAFDCRIESLACDLSMDVDPMALRGAGLVTASALLDLVSEAWLRRLADRCAEADAAVCFALSYDGRIECTPPDPADAEIRDLLNAHQRTDKGFGPALGPDAVAAAAPIFSERGYRTSCAESAWLLGPSHAELQRSLVSGWFQAAYEIAPQREAELSSWLERRRIAIAGGRLELMVGHLDMIGIPASDTF